MENNQQTPKARMIWHGEWSDPEIEISFPNGDKEIFNYYDVEDMLDEEEYPEGIASVKDEDLDEVLYNATFDMLPSGYVAGEETMDKIRRLALMAYEEEIPLELGWHDYEDLAYEIVKVPHGHSIQVWGHEIFVEDGYNLVTLDGREFRRCSVCGALMTEGYLCEGDGSTYCSDECLHKEVSEEEYDRLYDEGVMYYTEWY